MNKCYSNNGEEYRYDCFAEAALDVCDDLEAGEISVVYEGEPIVKAMSTYAPCADNLLEDIQERAWEDMGEWADGFLDKTTIEQEKDLEEMIKSTLDEWATKHKLQPTFYGVKTLKEIKVRALIDKDGCTDFELVEDKTI